MRCDASAQPLNVYGELASDLWRAADERRFFEMPRRDEFFAELGLRISQRVDQLMPLFAGVGPSGEPRRRRDLRLRKAKKQAEELAYQELLFSQSVVPADEDVVEELGGVVGVGVGGVGVAGVVEVADELVDA